MCSYMEPHMIWEFKHVVFSRCTDAYLLVFVAGSRTPSGPLFCVSNGMYRMKKSWCHISYLSATLGSQMQSFPMIGSYCHIGYFWDTLKPPQPRVPSLQSDHQEPASIYISPELKAKNLQLQTIYSNKNTGHCNTVIENKATARVNHLNVI